MDCLAKRPLNKQYVLRLPWKAIIFKFKFYGLFQLVKIKGDKQDAY